MSYSLKELSAGMGLAAVSAAALAYPSYLWAVSLFTITVVMVALSGLAVAMIRPRRSPFLTGFFAMGLVFLLLCYGPDWLRGRLAVNLVPNYAALRWASYLEESSKPQVSGAQVTRVLVNDNVGSYAAWQISQGGAAKTVVTPAPPNATVLTDITASLFVLLVAVIGGLVGRFCQRPSAQPQAGGCAGPFGAPRQSANQGDR